MGTVPNNGKGEKMRKTVKVMVGVISLGLLLIGVSRTAFAKFPDKDIVWVVPFRAGGGFDSYARTIARVMPKYLPNKVNIIIKNMGGAGGTVGTSYLYRSKPDGYTIGILNFPGMAIAQKFKRTEYDINKFVYLGMVGTSVYLLAVPAHSRFRTLKDLQNAKKPVRFASEGKGATADFMLRVATKTLHIPTQIVTGYKGAPTVILAAIKGDVDASLYGSLEVNLRFIRSGDLKPICIFDTKRSSLLPNVPTITELGYSSDLTKISLMRFVALPPKTPRERAATLRKALRLSLADKMCQEWAKKHDVSMKWGSEKLVKEKIARFLKVADKYAEFFK